jgi:hypothetical protein
MATLLLELSGNATPSRLPVGAPLVADVTISTRSLPFEASKENGVVSEMTMSKGHGPGAAQPGEDAENGALNTVVASGPTLFANAVLGRLWPLRVLGYAGVVDSVIFKEL